MRSVSDAASDIEMVNGLVSGGAGSFDLFYERYGDLIYHCIRRRIRDQSDAEDIYQEFFARLQATRYRALDKWRRESPLPNYLLRVVRNSVIDFQRSQRRRELRNRAGIEEGINQPEPTDPGAYAALEARDLRKSGIRAWGRLRSARDKRLICNEFHRGLPSEVLAEREGLNKNALAQAAFNARRRFLAQLRDLAPEFFPESA
jgi:RNA polymerase sigma factor (sigma-70 family)